MELIPCKIDWKKYKEHFPTREVTWVLELEANFPDRDMTHMHEAYTAAYEQMAKHLPTATRKALGLFVAGTSCNYVDGVEFDAYQFDGGYDPEAFEDIPQPHLDPKGMKRVAKALKTLEASDYQNEVRAAWQQANVGKDAMVKRVMKTADDFFSYLELWIAAFKEIERDGAVLGFEVA